MPEFELPPELVLVAFLPPLLFSAALFSLVYAMASAPAISSSESACGTAQPSS